MCKINFSLCGPMKSDYPITLLCKVSTTGVRDHACDQAICVVSLAAGSAIQGTDCGNSEQEEGTHLASFVIYRGRTLS